MDAAFSTEGLKALLVLTGLEIVLGIDNLAVLAIVTSRLERHQRPRARRLGLLLAMLMRILLLLSIVYLMSWNVPLCWVFGAPMTGKAIVLVVGGSFLVAKSGWYIVEKLRHRRRHHGEPQAAASFTSALVQIVLLDLVFSLDSVITAVGLGNALIVMVAAIVIAILIMMLFAGPVSHVIYANPSLETLALTFLVVVGGVLVIEGFGGHVDRAAMYFALVFALATDVLNNRIRKIGEAQSPS